MIGAKSAAHFFFALLVACGNGQSVEGDAASSELHDELSMPLRPTLSADDFGDSSSCGTCHTQHYSEWKTSMHAYAMVDPVYQALVRKRQTDLEGMEDRFCLQCHSPVASRTGEIRSGFAFDELSERTMQGIGCETCHKISSIQRVHNAGFVLDGPGPIRGPISDPVQSPAHASEFSPIFESSELCGACHDVVESSGLILERPYAEWSESPARSEMNCQSCHMPEYEGSAVSGGPIRSLHRHRWVGVDVPLIDGFVSPEEEREMESSIAQLLQGAGSVFVEVASPARAGERLDIHVTLKNNIPAHNLPTGSTFVRQLWLELEVRDANDLVVYETGHLDAQGDLKNYFSETEPFGDPDLIVLGSNFVDSTGTPELFSWMSSEHSSTTLSPLYERTHTLFFDIPTGVSFPLQINARLLFRTHPPYLLRALGLDDLIGKLRTYEIDSTELSLQSP